MMIIRYLLFASVFVLINAGHYLIWLPTMSKSVKIGFMDVGHELAKRGHEVTVVTPFKSQTEVAGVREILVDSNFHEVTDAITEEEFVKGNTFVMPIDIQIDVSIEDNRNALRSRVVQEMFEAEKIDVLMTLPWFGNEASYFLAHKHNASLVIFMTSTFTTHFMSWAVGDPFNPAYVPSGMTGYSSRMTFSQRLANTLVTCLFYVVR